MHFRCFKFLTILALLDVHAEQKKKYDVKGPYHNRSNTGTLWKRFARPMGKGSYLTKVGTIGVLNYIHSIFKEEYISLVNQKQAQNPIVPVNMKKAYEKMSMYPKYRATDTGFVIPSFVKK